MDVNYRFQRLGKFLTEDRKSEEWRILHKEEVRDLYSSPEHAR
jgi:hypothetical protein